MHASSIRVCGSCQPCSELCICQVVTACSPCRDCCRRNRISSCYGSMARGGARALTGACCLAECRDGLGGVRISTLMSNTASETARTRIKLHNCSPGVCMRDGFVAAARLRGHGVLHGLSVEMSAEPPPTAEPLHGDRLCSSLGTVSMLCVMMTCRCAPSPDVSGTVWSSAAACTTGGPGGVASGSFVVLGTGCGLAKPPGSFEHRESPRSVPL